MAFKDLSIFSPGMHFVQQSITLWEILVEGLMRSIYVKLYLGRQLRRCL